MVYAKYKRQRQRVDAYIRDLRDSLHVTVTNGSGFYLPEKPKILTKNFHGFFLFMTQLERLGFKVKISCKMEFKK
jgi:hypothetical protein